MLDRDVKRKRDTTDYSSPVDHDRQLKQLRFLHGYVPPESVQKNIVDGRYKSIEVSRQQDLEVLLERAKPEPPPEAVSNLEKMKQSLSGENKLLRDEYKNSFKQVLEILSPETVAEYEKHGIELVVNEDISYPTTREIGGNKQLHLPTKYEYPIKCMILRCVDEILKIKLEGARDIVQDLAMRVEITARIFQTNMLLGKYGWDIKGYELAEKYHKDYDDGIRKSIEEGLINKNAPKDNLMQIGNKYAHRKLLDSIMPTKDVPRIFPSMQPGAYFEEFNIKERTIQHKKPNTTFLAKEPVKLGADGFNELVKDINLPKDKEEYSLFNVVILPNKEIWVLPFRFPEGQKSQHSIVAKGNPCAWAGEVKIKGNQIISLNDKSGHYKTYVYSDNEQKEIDTFALETFRQYGYDVPQAIEHTAKSRTRELASWPRFQNER
jgi:hypothetical protein